MERILVTGALGQLGTELVPELKKIYGNSNVISTDLHPPVKNKPVEPFYILDVMNQQSISEIVMKFEITQIYHLAAVLSANAEKNPTLSWNINMNGLINVLEVSRYMGIKKVFWPSSIAVFGPDTPGENTPQYTLMNPNTIYGISKLAGEELCAYYSDKYGLDVRSLRYPGLIGYKSLPGGGTTDYAVDIYHQAILGKTFICFLSPDTYLPMMYMPDAIRATIELMEHDKKSLRVKTSYNLSGFSISPEELFLILMEYYPEFRILYKPDFRQKIADSWPDSIDDTFAREDWGWKAGYGPRQMTEDMIVHLSKMILAHK